MTGLIPETPEERAYERARNPVITNIKLNNLGLQRINAARLKQGQPLVAPGTVEAVPFGSEIEVVQGVDGNKTLFVSNPTTPALPEYVDNSTLKYFPPIRSQGGLPSCGVFNGTYYVMTHMLAMARDYDAKNGGDSFRLSPRFTYNLVNGGAKVGSWYYWAYRIGQKHGCVTWEQFPYTGDYRVWPQNGEHYREAIDRKFLDYGYIAKADEPDGMDEIKQLLNNGYILNYATYISSWQYKSVSDDPATSEDDSFVGKPIAFWMNGTSGYHGMTLVGYNDHIWCDINSNGTVDTGEKGAFRIANSWGSGWRDGGFCWVAYDALKAVSGVSGGPSSGRIKIFQDNKTYWCTATASYTPSVVARFTLNHLKRNQLRMTLGISDTSTTTPDTTWYPTYLLSFAGGAYAFNGSTTACDTTFYFDFTDIMPSAGQNKRWYVGMYDSAVGDIATIKDFTLVNVSSGRDIICTDTPKTGDKSQEYVWVDYTYQNETNTPPTISDIADTSTDEDTSTGPIAFTVDDNETSVGLLLLSKSSSNTTLIPVNNISFGGSGANRTVTVNPAADKFGSATITVTVSDFGGLSAQDSFVITVNPVQDSPVANNDSAVCYKDSPITIHVLANDKDVDGDTLTVDSVTQPANGTVVNNGSDVTYTPDSGHTGTDTFTYTISDGNGNTDSATVTVHVMDKLKITVNSIVNEYEIKTYGGSQDGNSTFEVQDSGTAFFIKGNGWKKVELSYTVTANTVIEFDFESGVQGEMHVIGFDTDNTISPGTSFQLYGTQTWGIGDYNDYSGSAPDSKHYIIPVGAHFTGSYIYFIFGNDHDVSSPTGEGKFSNISIYESGSNNPPDAVNDTASTNEDTAKTIDVLANDTDPDSDPLTVASVTQPANGTVVNNGSDVTYTPDSDFHGTGTFTYTASDGKGGTDTATVTVTVNSVNDAPVAVNDSTSTNEDTAKTIDVLANDLDVEGDTLTVASVTQPSNGSVANNGSDVTYTPDGNFHGTDTFTYTASDGNEGADTATVTVTVTSVNDIPVAVNDTASTPEDTGKTINVLANDTDPDGDTLTVDSVTQPANGSVANNGSDVTYTPDTGYTGTDTFTYTASDGKGGTDTATVTVTVSAVNDAPVAADQAVSTPEDTAVGITLTASDADGDALTYSIVTQPTHGILSGTAPNVTYTPEADYTGTDSFTFKANDGTADSNIATVSITITPVNDAPVANDQSVSTAKDTAAAITLTATDGDGDALTYSIVSDPSHGTISGMEPDVIYTPESGYTGPDSFTFKANDGTVDSDTATVSITVTDDTVTIVSVSTSGDYSLASAVSGAFYYIDRSYTIQGISSGLVDGILVRTANDDKCIEAASHLTLLSSEETVVSVCYDPRAVVLPDWLDDGTWTLTSEYVDVPSLPGSPLDVYAKTFPAGNIELGGNAVPSAEGSLSNYIVIISPTDGTTQYTEGPVSSDAWAHEADTDGDGLFDEYEDHKGLDREDIDTDGDTLVDEEEEGMWDGQEDYYSPNDKNSKDKDDGGGGCMPLGTPVSPAGMAVFLFVVTLFGYQVRGRRMRNGYPGTE